MPKTLTPELKAALVELLAEEDEEIDDPVEDEEEADEFVYKGRRYRYVAEDVEEAEEVVKEKTPAKKAPVKRTSKKVTEEPEPEEEASAPVKRRFLT